MDMLIFRSSDGNLGISQVFFDEIEGFHGISCEHIMNMVDFNETLDLYETVRKPSLFQRNLG